jgi:uncharacterized protein
MKWSSLDQPMIDPLLRFLGPREAGCVGFTSQIYDGGQVVIPARRRARILVRTEGESVTGAVLQLHSGLFFPVLDRRYPVIERSAVEKLARPSLRIYSVMGSQSDVVAFEQAIRREPVAHLDYYLMVQSQLPVDRTFPRLPDGLEVYEASVRDVDRLFDIQKKYEIEEVLLPGNTFQAGASRRHLEETLQKQLVLFAELQKVPVAKVGTNARGIFYDQIGGVFTEKRLRSRGLSSYLMTELMKHISGDHKSSTLFVKKDNGPALRMYTNLGFTNEDDFRISYFG